MVNIYYFYGDSLGLSLFLYCGLRISSKCSRMEENNERKNYKENKK